MRRALLIILGLGLTIGFICGRRTIAQYGPGDHWVESCMGGQDTFTKVLASARVDITLDCQADTTLPGSGSAVILRNDPSDDSRNYPGSRPTDGHLDVIDTEILSLSLICSGATIVAGAGQGQGGVLPASPGVIAEETADSALAESFFDCYLEAHINGQYVYNYIPIRLQASIDRFPPYGQTYSFTGCIPPTIHLILRREPWQAILPI